MSQIKVVKNIIDANSRIANENRKFFKDKGIFVINLMSSPGAGKTTLLEKIIPELKKEVKVGVIEGDIQNSYDAERILKFNIPVVQINTYGACHIDGNMVKEALAELPIDKINFLIVENVGNLVCPAEFDIGEDLKIMMLSVTEGDDKPLKYPLIFNVSKGMIISKIDLLPYVNFNTDNAINDSKKINPDLEIFKISCKTDEGIGELIDWLMINFNSSL